MKRSIHLSMYIKSLLADVIGNSLCVDKENICAVSFALLDI